MIGDRQHDMRAARMNGARAIGVLWGYGTREELAGADAIGGPQAGGDRRGCRGGQGLSRPRAMRKPASMAIAMTPRSKNGLRR